ncbi:methionyl-tRNA formyltransferase [Paucibacter sp. TC2R-5]|uniref:methionyl-tRNA formyltransferase n=1 Tax=Paucibacter sp. TC2R-5 TaxID=2893555 RepID=UPI0021E44905|nr:methionyl-tRNA formyltransferase [Paucibacter sp. TC2R-5]MCV2361516.1 methionyl-tRNA formyltransferase [Paucibacter sp. TC2R-5]
MTAPLRVIFAGTPEFAATALKALLDAGFSVPLVLTQPDRPAGRGMKLQASAVKELALQHGTAVAQPRSLRLDGKFPEDAAAARQALLDAQAEVMVVAAYGLILPQWVLDLPPLGCLNIHASLLPRWRGAAPIHRAIEAGDAETGITIMQMDAGLDTGAMLMMAREPIEPSDNTSALHDRLAALGGQMIVAALKAPAASWVATPQPSEGVNYAHKIEKTEAQIDWAQPAAQIERRLRAFDPFPGGLTQLDGEAIKCWRGEVCAGAGEPGLVLRVDEQGVVVACGEQALRLTELQRAGAKRLPAQVFLQARAIPVGARFSA